MNHHTHPSENNQGYSPFWSCFLVFIAICIANIFQFMMLIEQNKALKTAQQNTLATTERVLAAQSRIEQLAKDLLELAKTNSNAKKVAEEFNIQLINPLENTSGEETAPVPENSEN